MKTAEQLQSCDALQMFCSMVKQMGSLSNLSNVFCQKSLSSPYPLPTRLLETGFLAIFLSSPVHLSTPPSLPVLWLFRWLCFRSSGDAGKPVQGWTTCNENWVIVTIFPLSDWGIYSHLISGNMQLSTLYTPLSWRSNLGGCGWFTWCTLEPLYMRNVSGSLQQVLLLSGPLP